ncbi:MAG: SRPBCC domain-containing protein [Planctomycetes bacterium]|nr:SRPBCC domain-containing protein [Planctomycetota bacterium]
MQHYHRQISLSADRRTVYRALATEAGLRRWWTRTCDVESHVGGHATFHFGPHVKVMEIEALVPEREVRWRCIAALIDLPELGRKDEWVGTRIEFRLSDAAGGRTLLEFQHVGLTPDLECHALCTQGWERFLASLQAEVELGLGTPFSPGATVGCGSSAAPEVRS